MLHETVVDLELTCSCCSNCSFCPREKIRRLRQMIRMETVESLARYLSPDHVVWFSGMGEPLVHKEFVAIVRTLKGTGCLVYTNTNGMAPEMEVKLAVAKPDFVNLSLYGLDRESFKITTGRDMFNVVKERILWLQTSGLKWRLSYVTEEKDPARVEELKARLQDMSSGNARVLTKHSRSFGAEGQEVPKVCGLCDRYLFLACDGRILSCAHDVAAENSYNPEDYEVGPDGLEDRIIWASAEKRMDYPFASCSRCDSNGLKYKALEPDYFDKVKRLGR